MNECAASPGTKPTAEGPPGRTEQSALDLQAYEVGLRLAQVRVVLSDLDFRDVTGETSLAVTSESHLQQVLFALCSLERACEKVLQVGEGNKQRLAAVRNLLQHCEQELRFIADEENEQDPHRKAAERVIGTTVPEVQELISKSIDPLNNRKTPAALWFLLGRQIVAGALSNPQSNEPQGPAILDDDYFVRVLEAASNPDYSHLEWVWDDAEGLFEDPQSA